MLCDKWICLWPQQHIERTLKDKTLCAIQKTAFFVFYLELLVELIRVKFQVFNDFWHQQSVREAEHVQ